MQLKRRLQEIEARKRELHLLRKRLQPEEGRNNDRDRHGLRDRDREGPMQMQDMQGRDMQGRDMQMQM
jgi:hypothetical protein